MKNRKKYSIDHNTCPVPNVAPSINQTSVSLLLKTLWRARALPPPAEDQIINVVEIRTC
jgi:hypothetical protein